MTDHPQEHESLDAFVAKVEASGEDKKHEAFEPVLDDISEGEMAAAIRTLRGMGYAWAGGEQWKPPIGKKPDFAAIDALRGKMDAAMDIITKYGGIDGAHHKTWVIDQAARALLGNGYAAWVAELCDGEDGPHTYDYDEGINP